MRIASTVTLLKAIARLAKNSKMVTFIGSSFSQKNMISMHVDWRKAMMMRYGFLFRPKIRTLSVMSPKKILRLQGSDIILVYIAISAGS